jgi:hypothetical protein
VHTHGGFETFCVLAGEFVIHSPYAASRQYRPEPNAGADSTGGGGGVSPGIWLRYDDVVAR